MLEKTWRMSKNGQEYGPYTLTQLRQYAAEGRILPDDLLWTSGMSEWIPASQLPELSASLYLTPMGQDPLSIHSEQGETLPNPLPASGGPARAPSRGKGKSALIVVIVLIVLIAAVVFLLLPKGFGVSLAALASEVDEDWKPVKQTDTFTPDTAEILASVQLRSPKDGTAVTAEWYMEDADDGDFLIDSYTQPLSEEDDIILFSLSRPNAGWPTGSYRVDLVSDDGSVLKSLPFTIEDGTGMSSTTQPEAQGLQVTGAVAATGVDSDFLPTGIRSDFVTTTPEIFIFVDLTGVDADSTLTSEWNWLDDNLQFGEYTLDIMTGEESVYFSMTMPDAGWPTGSYEVDLVAADGSILGTVPFTVAEGSVPDATTQPAVQGMQITRAVVCTGVDSNFLPVGIGDDFSTTTPEIVIFADLTGVDTDRGLTSYWFWLDEDLQFGEYTLDLTAGEESVYFSMTIPDDGWPTGSYKVDLIDTVTGDALAMVTYTIS